MYWHDEHDLNVMEFLIIRLMFLLINTSLDSIFCQVKTVCGCEFIMFKWLLHIPSFEFPSSVGRLNTADGVDHLCNVHLVDLPPPHRAGEHFPEAFPEMLGHKGVDDGVKTGVGISHQVGQDAQDVGGVVEREVSEPHADNDQVMGEPAEAKNSSDNDDHLRDLPLGSPQLGHVLNGIHAGPQVSNGAGVGETEHQDGDEIAEHKGAHVHYDAWFGLPDRNTHHGASQVHLSVVAEIRS